MFYQPVPWIMGGKCKFAVQYCLYVCNLCIRMLMIGFHRLRILQSNLCMECFLFLFFFRYIDAATSLLRWGVAADACNAVHSQCKVLSTASSLNGLLNPLHVVQTSI